MFLRKFEFSKALDSVLKPYVQKKFPEYTYSVLKELKRRNVLRTAIGGRTESGLAPLVNYTWRNISNPNYLLLLVEVADIILGMAIVLLFQFIDR